MVAFYCIYYGCYYSAGCFLPGKLLYFFREAYSSTLLSVVALFGFKIVEAAAPCACLPTFMGEITWGCSGGAMLFNVFIGPQIGTWGEVPTFVGLKPLPPLLLYGCG